MNKIDKERRGWVKHVPNWVLKIFRKESNIESISSSSDVPYSNPESMLHPDEYSNSSRLHLASSGGPPPDILLQSGI